jgi:hypothetical protein
MGKAHGQTSTDRGYQLDGEDAAAIRQVTDGDAAARQFLAVTAQAVLLC